MLKFTFREVIKKSRKQSCNELAWKMTQVYFIPTPIEEDD